MSTVVGEIRQFRVDDADAAAAIIRACIELDSTIPLLARKELAIIESPAAMIDYSRLYYVAVCVLDCVITGVAGLDLNEIRLLFVDPAHQRKGIGSRLLQHMEAFVPPALFSDVFVYAAPGAVDFYRKHGYRWGGAHDFNIAGEIVPTVFMTKGL